MATQALKVSEQHKDDISEQLYRHSRKPEWGLALLAWERNGRRAYQFEDGKLRKIREGYYDLVEPVEPSEGSTETVRASLEAAIQARTEGSQSKARVPVCTFDQQISLFTELYPKGFQDPQWIEDKRGTPEGSSLKRHREPAIEAAQEVLDPSRASGLIEEGRHAELAESIFDVMAGTNLVPLKHVKALRGLAEEETTQYTEVAFNLVHGDEPFDDRFRVYLKTLARFLGGRPSWRAATALAALIHPQEQVAVRRSAFARQAGSIAPMGKYTRKPKVDSYRSYRRVAVGVRQRLEGAGHEPRDLLDVHDFIWTTLRKSALDHL